MLQDSPEAVLLLVDIFSAIEKSRREKQFTFTVIYPPAYESYHILLIKFYLMDKGFFITDGIQESPCFNVSWYPRELIN